MTGPEHPAPDHPAPDDGLELPADLQDVAESLRGRLHEVRARPDFRDRLRAELVAARTEAVAARDTEAVAAREDGGHPDAGGRVLPFPRRAPAGGAPGRRTPGRRVAAWTAAAALVVVAGGLAVDRIATGPAAVAVAAASELQGAISADPTAALRVSFSRPVDRASVAAALRISPATQLRTAWQGDVLQVDAVHGFAPNTSYRLDIDRAVARTATGARLAADVGITFGTAATAPPPPPGSTVADLAARPLTAAADGSEAAFTAAGALLVTGARPGTTTVGSGLVRVAGTSTTTLAPATDAICVSRSGRSVAFVTRADQGSQVVFADTEANPLGRASVAVDAGSPIGWIDDGAVSFVGGHRLRAVDRQGQVRVLSPATVVAGSDTLVIAPGGRYVYLRPAGAAKDAAGEILDLVAGTRRPLPGSFDQPAFSADGATVIWIDGRGPAPTLAESAAAGGPVLTAALPVAADDQLGGLSVAPDGSRFGYVVTSPGGRAQLRLASLADGHTLAVLAGGAGSLDWAPTSRTFSVLRAGEGGSRIDTVQLPADLTGRYPAAQAVASAFARAQVGHDPAAQAALGSPGLVLPATPRPTRAQLLWLDLHADGTARAEVRLGIDPTPGHDRALAAVESLTLSAAGDGFPTVTAATVTAFRDAPDGPGLTGSQVVAPRSVTLSFDSDLDPAGLQAAVTVTAPTGAPLRHATTFDPTSRTVTVSVTDPQPGPFTVLVGTGLRDIEGHPLPQALTVPVTSG